MARKPTTGKINEAKKRVAEAQKAKQTVFLKPGAKPVYRTNSAKRAETVKKGLSLKDMLRETTARTRELMKQGDVSVIGMKKSKSGRSILSQTVTRHSNKPNTYYRQAITNEDSDNDSFSRSRRLKAECNCPRYKFAHDWTLHQKDASDLNYSIDEPSYITNPKQLHGVCKHLLRVFNTIVSSGR